MVAHKAPPQRVRRIVPLRTEQTETLKHSRTATIGGRIREARLNASRSQEEVAKAVSLGRSAVAQWERLSPT